MVFSHPGPARFRSRQVPVQGSRSSGVQPFSAALRLALAAQVPPRCPDELVVVHHYTDHPEGLQLEIERRSAQLGLRFERLVL